MTKNTQKQVRVRFAPSPTGYLHVGGARTALYNYLYAKKTGGVFVLRIEDTDQERSTEEALKMQLNDLKWLGLDWNEGPGKTDLSKEIGDCGPYRQSARQAIYQKYADQLLASGKAYHCFCTDEELERKKQAAMKEGRPPHYDGTCRNLGLEAARTRKSKGEKACVRFNVGQPKDYILNDIIRGEVVFPSSMVGDFVMLRSDGMPVYNFCCVIDDALMEITYVLRAEEHLSNTLRQMMLYEAINYPIPRFGHLSIMLGPDKQKLSKRHGATSCNEYKNLGFLPEAIKNYIALLGWSSPDGKEIMSEAEMIERFDLDRFTPSAAVFDETKLKYFNATHLRALPHAELWERLQPFFTEAGLEFNQDEQWVDKALGLLKTSMETLKDGVELFRLLSDSKIEITGEGRETMSWPGATDVVKKWKDLVAAFDGDFMSEADFSKIQDQVKTECNVKGKFLFMPIRVGVIGKPHGAELKHLVPLLSKASLLGRAEKCLKA